MGVKELAQLVYHAQRGALFENLVVTEFLKGRFNRGQPADLYFWRDSKGLEVDLLVDDGIGLLPVEIKSGQTIVSDFLTSLNKWHGLSGKPDRPAALVYGEDKELVNVKFSIIPWRNLATLAMLSSCCDEAISL